MGMINTGITALQAAQLGLQTTSHNIANASTPGYNRQRIVQATNTAQMTGSGFIGQGVNVSTIERMYSNFLSAQVNNAQATSSELDAYYAQIQAIDNMLADSTTGVSSALQDFFTGVQEVSANPKDISARQSMVSSAQSLVARFQAVSGRINEMYDGVNSQITSTVSSINAYAAQIARLNESIGAAQSSNYQPANDLLDQRDQLVSELNKLVKVSTTTNSNGSFNVFIGTGQQLVVGTQVSEIVALPSDADPSRLVLGLKTPGRTQELPESLITGGSLAGLLSFRSGSLDRVANDLGRNATSLALTFNAQNALGQDLLGNIAGDTNFVGDFFNVPTPKVVASTSNKSASPDVSVVYSSPIHSDGNYTDLTNSDYRLDYNGTNLTLTRLSDKKQWSAANITGLNAALAVDPQGFEFPTPPITFVASDAGASYLIQPTRGAASEISVNTAVAADPRLLAAAAPIRTQAGATNTGSAAISAGSVAAGYNTTLLPATLTYGPVLPSTLPPLKMSATVPVSVTHNGVPTAYAAGASWDYVSGDTISINGSSFEISGVPSNGDKFTIDRNTGAVSDGRNALALGQLQTKNTMSGKTATYQSAYAQLVSDVGNKTREIEVKGDAQSALLALSEEARDSLSGVNLDEEAANLLRYQQAYQASAKVLQIGNTLFDSLLSIMS